MNKNNTPHNEEVLIKKFLTNNAHTPRHNEWFARRVINRLPSQQSSVCRVIMSITTLIAVIVCGCILYLSTDYILQLKYGNHLCNYVILNYSFYYYFFLISLCFSIISFVQTIPHKVLLKRQLENIF